MSGDFGHPPAPQGAASGAAPLSKLAVAGLVLAIIGLCFFPLELVGAGLGLLALLGIRKDPRLRGRVPAILALASPLVAVATTGVIAAIAIPAFIEYTRAAQSSEVEANLSMIHLGVASYYESERVGPGGMVETATLPPATPLTPAQVPCGAAAAWPGGDPAWAALGFEPYGTVRYSYQYTPGPDARSYVVSAVGDLDCDGRLSRTELRGFVTEDGRVEREPELLSESPYE